ncbi:MAG TPA: hypothetical protein VJ385_08970 [Fibrobacteria bacterium]|nr:hypothetical protein [Fibrobacteria bacterium]
MFLPLAGGIHAGLLGGLLGGGGGGQAIDPVGLGYNEKTQSNGGQGQQHVIPGVESCRDNGNGTYTATWGYFNMNNYSVTIPIGTGNKFYPGNADRGQPTTFLVGERHNVFTTTYSGTELTWILDGRTASVQSCNCTAACPFRDSLLVEGWDAFNAARWQGDGDQVVSGGYFTIRLLAFSAFADWLNPAPVPLEANVDLHLDQTFRFTYPLVQVMAQSAALYMVNKDKDGTFTDYAFVNIGYTGLPDNKFFVEIFGADGGVGFDQVVVTDIAAAPDKTFKVDLRISRNAYQVAVDGAVVNTVTLVNALPQIDLVEVGVQRNLVGLEGRIDATYIYKTCR